MARGSFALADVIRALDNNAGIEDAALLELQKNQLKPFLMRIWGPPVGVENDEAAPHGGQWMLLETINYFYYFQHFFSVTLYRVSQTYRVSR